jgi:hypothetical protein
VVGQLMTRLLLKLIICRYDHLSVLHCNVCAGLKCADSKCMCNVDG